MEEDKQRRVFVLNLRYWIPQKDVVKKILSYLNDVDVAMVMMAHNREREKTLKEKWGSDLCDKCAKYGYTTVILWLKEKGCEWSWKARRNAAGEGHTETLKILKECGTEWESLSL